jgi:hypothetical protein
MIFGEPIYVPESTLEPMIQAHIGINKIVKFPGILSLIFIRSDRL